MSIGTPIAIPWYESERDYLAVVAMLPAAERQDPLTHDAFMSKIKRQEQDLKSKGAIPVRVPIDAVTLKGWCDANNQPVCGRSIVEYGMICAVLILRRDAGHN